MSRTTIDREQFLDHLAADIESFAVALDTGPLDAAVPWCGAWTLGDLGRHLGGVHRWSTGAVVVGTAAGANAAIDTDPAPADAAELGAWVRSGGVRLLAALRTLDPDAPTWHPFPIPKVGAVWPRRQAQEASVHRWDAQRAIGGTPTIDADLAADGIDEYFGVALPRLIHREGVLAPEAPLRVETTDTGDRWIVAARNGTVEVLDDVGVTPSSEIVGTAEHVLLALWRRPVPPEAVAVTGASIDWLELGGI